MKRHFDDELSELKKSVLEMSSLAQRAIHASIESLKKLDGELAKIVIEDDKVIDELENAINDQCLDMLALHQPMASDLRLIAMTMNIATDLERIADLAVDIAERTLEICDKPLLKPLVDIPQLALLAQDMTQRSTDAFLNGDIEMAKDIILLDTQADKLRDDVQEELITGYMAKDSATVTRALPLLLVARHLERICDHATNIAEDVIFLYSARVVKHHKELL
jgi:phosphate transport system protein